MARRIIDRLRDKIRAGEYVVSFHAANELDDDEISIFDVENIILTGEITERQRDAQTRERKYVIKGATLDRETALLCRQDRLHGKGHHHHGLDRGRQPCNVICAAPTLHGSAM